MDPGKQAEGFRRKGGREMGEPGDGIKGGTDCMEHRVLYANNESWNTTSKANDALHGD